MHKPGFLSASQQGLSLCDIKRYIILLLDLLPPYDVSTHNTPTNQHNSMNLSVIITILDLEDQ